MLLLICRMEIFIGVEVIILWLNCLCFFKCKVLFLVGWNIFCLNNQVKVNMIIVERVFSNNVLKINSLNIFIMVLIGKE